MVSINNFRDLDIWKNGIILVKGIYRVTEAFPRDEMYGLSSQMRRAAISVPSNVSEGFRRRHPKEFKHFLSITLGSLAELETQIVIAHELDYLDKQNYDEIIKLIDYISRMITSLYKKL